MCKERGWNPTIQRSMKILLRNNSLMKACRKIQVIAATFGFRVNQEAGVAE